LFRAVSTAGSVRAFSRATRASIGTCGAAVDGACALSFLVGTWDSPPGTGGASGGSIFKVSAQGRVLLRRNFAESSKGRHDDTMMVFALPNGVHAVCADNEGHVIDYPVTATDNPRIATFVSSEAPGAPRFRLSYRLLDDGAVAGKFEMQPPGSPEFKPFLDWTMRKR
jgi:hypothetical protein